MSDKFIQAFALILLNNYAKLSQLDWEQIDGEVFQATMGAQSLQIRRVFDLNGSYDYFIGLYDENDRFVGEVSDVELRRDTGRKGIFVQMNDIFKLAQGKANRSDLAVTAALEAIGLNLESEIGEDAEEDEQLIF